MSEEKTIDERRPHIQNSSLWVRREEKDPMADRFRIASTDCLDQMNERSLCERCRRSRRYYCYTCVEALPQVRHRLPVLSLPVRVDVVKHRQEVDGKSTAIHAAIIAPEDVTIHTFPDIPDWTGLRAVLVFPSPNAQSLKQLIESHGKSESSRRPVPGLPFDRVVFIDSTWRQTKAILSDPRIRSLMDSCVVLSDYESLFWRHQTHTPRTYLSTIEAIYYFFHELDKAMADSWGVTTDGHTYDNLLFFFKHTYNRLRIKYNI